MILDSEGHTSFPAGVSSTSKDKQLKKIFFCFLNLNDEAEKWDQELKTSLLTNKNSIFESLLRLGACKQ